MKRSFFLFPQEDKCTSVSHRQLDGKWSFVNPEFVWSNNSPDGAWNFAILCNSTPKFNDEKVDKENRWRNFLWRTEMQPKLNSRYIDRWIDIAFINICKLPFSPIGMIRLHLSNVWVLALVNLVVSLTNYLWHNMLYSFYFWVLFATSVMALNMNS